MRRRSRRHLCARWSARAACLSCVMLQPTRRSALIDSPPPIRAAPKARSCSSLSAGIASKTTALRPSGRKRRGSLETRPSGSTPASRQRSRSISQDYPIRLLLEGKSAPNEEQVTHDVLLKNGITLIEYLINTSALEGPRTLLCAAPLLIPNADGAPTRAFALESLNA